MSSELPRPGSRRVIRRPAAPALAPVAACLVAILLTHCVYAQRHDWIVSVGDYTPDGSGTFARISGQVLNNAGEVAFVGTLADTVGPPGDAYGIYRFGPNLAQQVVRAGTPSPDGDGTFTRFDEVYLNQQGTVMGRARFGGGGSGYVLGAAGVLSVPIRAGYDVPGGGKLTFLLPGRAELGSSGHVAFMDRLGQTSLGAADDDVVLRAGTGGLSVIVREGQLVPGLAGAVLGAEGGLLGGNVNASGQIPVAVSTSAGQGGVFLGSDALLTPLVTSLTPAPGLSGFFSRFDRTAPQVNDQGQVTFAAGLLGTGSTLDDSGLFRAAQGAPPVTVAREGWSAPAGAGAFNGAFDDFSGAHDPHVLINEVGDVAFSATLRGTVGGNADDQGIFRYRAAGTQGGGLIQLAREGQSAPDGNGVYSQVSVATLNASPASAFRATLAGTAGGDADDEGIFLTDGIETATVAREGDELFGSTITSFDLQGGTGRNARSSLNDHGQYVYQANLADGRNVVALFTPTLHYRSAASGSWDDSANWSLSIAPRGPHVVLIRPVVGLTITGPSAPVSIHYLSFEPEGPDPVRLELLPSGPIHVAYDVYINGHLTGAGSLTGGFFYGLRDSRIEPTGDMTLGGPDQPSGFQTHGQIEAGAVTLRLQSSERALIAGHTRLAGSTLIASVDLHNAGNLELASGAMVFTGGATSGTSGTIYNNGTISLAGASLLRSVILQNDSGQVVGQGTADATLVNGAGGTVRADPGHHLRFLQGGRSNGLLLVSGGQIDFDDLFENRPSQPAAFIPAGSIVTQGGTLRFDGGLHNSGSITGSSGVTDVYGAVRNNPDALIFLTGGSTISFQNDVDLAGLLHVSDGSTAAFFGRVDGRGPLGVGEFSGTGLKRLETGSVATLASLTSGGSVVVEAGASLAADVIREEGLTVRGSVSLNPGGGASVVTSLLIEAGGRFDLADSRLIVQSLNPTADHAALWADIASARDGGVTPWTGPGLTSSRAAVPFTTLALVRNSRDGLTTLYSEFAGRSVDVNSLLTGWTWAGDLNLDGVIDVDDYNRLDRGFLERSSGYDNGDLDYDSFIDLDDYALMDASFFAQTGPSGAASPSPVPEPGLLAMAPLALVLCRRRR